MAAAYEGLARAATLGATIAPSGDSKLLKSLRARHGVAERYRSWSRSGRVAGAPLLWMHAPSVGEGLQARPVLERLRAASPGLQLAYTFFSPSAEAFASRLDVDFRDYLPFDTAKMADVALDALQPRALVYSKLDVWPTLTRKADARDVRLGLVSATLSSHSSRRGTLALALLREAYARLDAVGAIDASDAERLVELGVARSAIDVTGDTRYDQVWARAQGVDRTSGALGALDSHRPTLVAGSTWPADERVVLAAWRHARRHSDARLIIAPHEPTPAHIAPIEQWARIMGVSSARLGGADAGEAEIVIVDRVGVLGDLYALADVAYVGGGFHSAGLHSVIEPAAFGAPVLIGPRWRMSRDAELLLGAGAAIAVSSAEELGSALGTWFTTADDRRAAGERAREIVRAGVGAAERTIRLVRRLL